MTQYRSVPHAEGVSVETGIIQFGKDSPGVFISGDDVLIYAVSLQVCLEHPSESHAADTTKSLVDLLCECRMAYLDHHRQLQTK